MICDDCKCKNKCTKIISEKANYCENRVIEGITFQIDKEEDYIVPFPKTKSLLNEYEIIWR